MKNITYDVILWYRGKKYKSFDDIDQAKTWILAQPVVASVLYPIDYGLMASFDRLWTLTVVTKKEAWHALRREHSSAKILEIDKMLHRPDDLAYANSCMLNYLANNPEIPEEINKVLSNVGFKVSGDWRISMSQRQPKGII